MPSHLAFPKERRRWPRLFFCIADQRFGSPGRALATREQAWVGNVTDDANFLRVRIAENLSVRSGFDFRSRRGMKVIAVLVDQGGERFSPSGTAVSLKGRVDSCQQSQVTCCAPAQRSKVQFSGGENAHTIIVARHNLLQLGHRFDRFARPIAAIL